MTAVAHRPSSQRSIPVRKLNHIDPFEDEARWIVADDPIFSHFLATLSAVFPAGEDFFVASVRMHRAALGDEPILRQQVKAFVGQEAMHGREHRQLNQRLAGLGYSTEKADRDISRICDRVLKMRPNTLPIAVTAAAEHVTGILGEAALGDDRTRATLFGRPDVEPLIAWHALEELEHKNVAFDVFEKVSGRYVVRVAGFFVMLTFLAGYVVREWARAVFADRKELSRSRLRTHWRNLGRQQLLSPWALKKLFTYLRPGFHPDDTNTDALVDEWRRRLESATTITAGSFAQEDPMPA
jgi:predicted metal-dependent hydrolase